MVAEVLGERGPLPDAKDAYLDSARECLIDLGWRRTTLTEVARRAGVSRMTIYRTWPDMSRLLAYLMWREWDAAITGSRQDRPAQTEGGTRGATDAAGRIAQATVGTIRALRNNELFVRIIELDPELLLPYLLHRPGRTQLGLIAQLGAAIAAGQATGEVRAGDPELLARAIVLTGHGFTLSAHTMAGDDDGLLALDGELGRLVEAALRP